MSNTKTQSSLRTRLYIGSGLLVAICLLSNVISWLGQEVLLANFRSSEYSEQIATEVLRVDHDAQQLKAHAENYAQTGTELQYQAALKLQVELLSAIGKLKTKAGDADPLTDLLEQMRVRISSFGDQMQLASAERTVRTDLLQNKLLAQELEVDQAIAESEAALAEVKSDSASRTLLVAVRQYAIAHKNLLRYFIEPSSEDYERMLSGIKESRAQVSLIELADDDQQPKAVQRAIAAKQRLLLALAEYQSLGTHAVQATRGYMYYVNVVMAGEISEFVHYSKEIKGLVDERREASRVSREHAVSRIRLFSVLAALLAVLVASGLAFRLSKIIFNPISGLTKTFLRLAEGETIERIPAVDRNDEIGRMARAAEVFSRKNQQTTELLQRSQVLSEELSKKAQMLEESNQELDNFAYVASHDLKSPLRGLRCLAEWVQEDCEGILSEESQKHLEQMQGRVAKMDTLLDDLLNYSRVGRTEQQSEQVDVGQLIQSILDITDVSNGVQVAVIGKMPVLDTLRAPLQQVLLNLITNAIKYNDKGADGRIEVACESIGGMVRFRVSDNGIGIAQRFHERIFQMYQRASSLSVEGSGMGLAIVKKQVETMGGEIHVESIEGDGSTFTFTWPIRVSEERPAMSLASTS